MSQLAAVSALGEKVTLQDMGRTSSTHVGEAVPHH